MLKLAVIIPIHPLFSAILWKIGSNKRKLAQIINFSDFPGDISFISQAKILKMYNELNVGENEEKENIFPVLEKKVDAWKNESSFLAISINILTHLNIGLDVLTTFLCRLLQKYSCLFFLLNSSGLNELLAFTFLLLLKRKERRKNKNFIIPYINRWTV